MSRTAMYDTLAYVRTLERSGFTAEQADGLRAASEILLCGSVATREDIAKLAMATKEDFADLRATTKEDITRLAMAAKEDIADLRTATKEDIADLRTATKEDIARLAMATKEDIAALGTATKEDFARLEKEITILGSKAGSIKWMLVTTIALMGLLLAMHWLH